MLERLVPQLVKYNYPYDFLDEFSQNTDSSHNSEAFNQPILEPWQEYCEIKTFEVDILLGDDVPLID